VAHGDAVTAPITAERLAEIDARANAIHAEMSHTRTRCRHCDTVNPPLDEWGCHDECPDAEEWPTEVERDGTKLESADGLREIAGHMTDLVAEVRRLTAALDLARREGREEMRERAAKVCADIASAHDALCIRKGARGEHGVAQEYGAAQCGAECGAAIRALPLDAPGGER
jgi:hypothetical protein